MAFTINPSEYTASGGGGGNRRPDVRDGQKVLWLAGIKLGQTRNGDGKIDACFVVVADPDGGSDVRGLVWETFPLTQRAAWKLQQVSQALGQRASWTADDPDAAWEVLSRRPVLADVRTEPKRSGDGTVAVVGRFHPFTEEVTEDMESIATEAEGWHRDWSRKRDGYGSSSQGSGYSSGGGYAPSQQGDDIPF